MFTKRIIKSYACSYLTLYSNSTRIKFQQNRFYVLPTSGLHTLGFFLHESLRTPEICKTTRFRHFKERLRVFTAHLRYITSSCGASTASILDLLQVNMGKYEQFTTLYVLTSILRKVTI